MVMNSKGDNWNEIPFNIHGFHHRAANLEPHVAHENLHFLPSLL